MLDSSKPIIGRDVEILRQKLGMTTQEMAALLGIPSMYRWSSIINANGDKPVSDINIAIMVRLLDEYPELNFIPQMPGPADIEEMITKIESKKPSSKRVGIMLGGESSAGYRWLTLGTRASPAVSRTCLFFLKLMQIRRKDGIKKWENIVTAEATSRNIRDIWSSGRWSQKKPVKKVTD